jgi:hypothetical protein
MDMKNISKKIAFTIVSLMFVVSANAGNEDRSGSASANQLLINPWARSSGLMGSNMAGVQGIEGAFLNVAGLAYVKRTEIAYANSNYLVGSDISINSIGLAQKIGDASVIGLTVMIMNYGDIEITSEDLPEGGVGKFSPRSSNFALSYARSFSNAIHGGITVRVISESIANMKASGVAFDAGIKYVTGKDDQFQLGITLKNFGPPLQFEGDGLYTDVEIVATGDQRNLRQTSEAYEIPALLSIGGSYNFTLADDHKLKANAAFVSNSFSRDQFNFGAEYGLKERFFLRAGYMLERTTTEDATSATAFTGLGVGGSIKLPLSAAHIMLNYSYRDTNPFNGVHSIGVSIALQ